MSARLLLEMRSHGSESLGTPVRVEVMDPAMRTVATRWGQTPGWMDFTLAPGTYGVRVSVASGQHLDLVAEVPAHGETTLPVPLHDLSPHEGHEWVYFTQKMAPPASRGLSDPLYEGAWLRLWEKGDGGWRPVPVPREDVQRLCEGSDGVSYRFRPPGYRPYVLQTGGVRIPWRCTALPPGHDVMVMVKPSQAGAPYPLDVVVTSGNWQVQTLLALLMSGDTSAARELDREARIAEQLLYAKMADATAAAVGGYFLLRIRDLSKLHDWASNLANWIDWMADGPVIHAWQLLAGADTLPEGREARTAEARARLLQASARGFPLYTEGLRLLRDGLLGLHRSAGGRDAEVATALAVAGEYLAVSDPSQPTTTFLGAAPDRPDDDTVTGLPEDGEPMMFVFDVPLGEVIRLGLLPEGARLVDGTERFEATLMPDGTIRVEDREEAAPAAPPAPGAASPTPAAPPPSAPPPPETWGWKVAGSDLWLTQVADQLRAGTFSRGPDPVSTDDLQARGDTA